MRQGSGGYLAAPYGRQSSDDLPWIEANSLGEIQQLHNVDPALSCSIAEMGIERILFSVDWPFMLNLAGRTWMDKAPVSDEHRTLIFGANARKLLKLP